MIGMAVKPVPQDLYRVSGKPNPITFRASGAIISSHRRARTATVAFLRHESRDASERALVLGSVLVH